MMSSIMSVRLRTRSMTRPRRFDVDRMKVPHADSSSAGVIIEVRTVSAADYDLINASGMRSMAMAGDYPLWYRALKPVNQSELHQSPVIEVRRDFAELRRVDIHVVHEPGRGVSRVESLGSKFDALLFRNGEAFDHTRVHVE